MQEMQIGIVKFFNVEKKYGFLQDEEAGDIYFNVNSYAKPVPNISVKGNRQIKTELSMCYSYQEIESGDKICFLGGTADNFGKRSVSEWMLLKEYEDFQREFERASYIYRVRGKDVKGFSSVLWRGLDPGYLDLLAISDPFLSLKIMSSNDVRYEKREIEGTFGWIPWIRE